MHKYIQGLFLLGIMALFISGCSNSKEVISMKNIKNDTYVYANYAYGDYKLSFVRQDTLKPYQSMQITKGWNDVIYKDDKGNIWFPMAFKPDMTTSLNKIFVFNINKGTTEEVEVGNEPKYVFFDNKNTYVVCLEDGNNPTIYIIDEKFHAKKWKSIPNGGLLAGAQFDGQAFYFSSLHNSPVSDDKHPDYPQLVKIPLQGDIVIQPLADRRKGFNGLLYVDNKLILGLQEGSKYESTLHVFDPKTLKKINSLPYANMVGDIIQMGNHKIAVSNYSKVGSDGNTISVIDLGKNQLELQFQAKNPVEHLSYIDGNFVVVNNRNKEIEILASDGTSKLYAQSPTQVTNLIKVK